MIMVVSNTAGEMLEKIIAITKTLLSFKRMWLHSRVIAAQKTNLVGQLNKLMEAMTPLLDSAAKKDMQAYKNYEEQFITLTKEYVDILSKSNIISIKTETVSASLDNINVSDALEALWTLPNNACNRLLQMGPGRQESNFVKRAKALEEEMKTNSEKLNVKLNEVNFEPILKKVENLKINGKEINDQNYTIMLTEDENLTFEFVNNDEEFVSRVFAIIGSEEEDIEKKGNKCKITSKGEDMKIDCIMKTEQIGDDEEEGIDFMADIEESLKSELKGQKVEGIPPPPPSPPPPQEENKRVILPAVNANNEQQGSNEDSDKTETKVKKKDNSETKKKQNPPGDQKPLKKRKGSHDTKSVESLENSENQLEEEVPVAAKSKITFKKNNGHKYTLEEVRKRSGKEAFAPALNGGKDLVVIEEDQSIELDKDEILTVTIYEEDGMRYKKCHLKGVELISTKSLEDIPGSVRLKFKLIQETEEGKVSFTFEKVEYDIAFYSGSSEIDSYVSWKRKAYLAKDEKTITLKNTSKSDLMIQCVWPNDMAMYFNKESNETGLLEPQKVKLPKGKGFDFTFIPNNNNMKQGINTFIWKIQIYSANGQKWMSNRAFRIITENNPQEHKDEREQPEVNDQPIVQKIKDLNNRMKSARTTIEMYNIFKDWIYGLSEEDLELLGINDGKNLMREIYFKMISLGEAYWRLWEQPFNQMGKGLKDIFFSSFGVRIKITKNMISIVYGLLNNGKIPRLKSAIAATLFPVRGMTEIVDKIIYIKGDEGQKELLKLKRTMYRKRELAADINDLQKNDSKDIEDLFMECIRRNNTIDEKTLKEKGFEEDDIKKLRENIERAKEKTISHHNEEDEEGLRLLKRLNKKRKMKEENGKTKFSAMSELEEALEVVKGRKVELSKLSEYSNDVILSRGFMVTTGIAKVSDVRSPHGKICKILIVTCEDIVKKQKNFNSRMLKKINNTKHLDVAIRLMICYVILHYGFPKLFGTDIAPIKKCSKKMDYIWGQVVKMPKLKSHIDDDYVARKFNWERDTKIGGFAQVHGGLKGDINSAKDFSNILKVLVDLNVARDLLAPFKDIIGTYAGLPLTINSIADIIEKNKLIIGKESSLGEVLHGLDLISQRFDNSSMIDQLIIKD